jgi:hypothetical protein
MVQFELQSGILWAGVFEGLVHRRKGDEGSLSSQETNS